MKSNNTHAQQLTLSQAHQHTRLHSTEPSLSFSAETYSMYWAVHRTLNVECVHNESNCTQVPSRPVASLLLHWCTFPERPAGGGALTPERPAGGGALTRESPAGDGALTRESPAGGGALTRERPAGGGALTRESPAGGGALTRESLAGDGALTRESPAGDRARVCVSDEGWAVYGRGRGPKSAAVSWPCGHAVVVPVAAVGSGVVRVGTGLVGVGTTGGRVWDEW